MSDTNMNKDFLSMLDFNKKEIMTIFKKSKILKKQKYNSSLKNKNIVLLFQKPSTRTRVSFEVGINQLGGNPIVLNWGELQLSRGETVEDSARVLERYCNMIVARVYGHEDLVKMSKVVKIPIVNSLSDLEHPCQIISDLFTIHEHFGSLKNLKMCYIGDGNNVCNSLILGCAIMGLDLSVSTPKEYEPDKRILKRAKSITRSKIKFVDNPFDAVKGADIIYTDVWVSMGQEKEENKRLKSFKRYQINSKILKNAKKWAVVMHCLPAHRGQEITDEVIDGPQSIVYDQAENRLHVQKAILLKLFK